MLTVILAALLSLTISPNVCFEPCTMRAVIRVEQPEKTHEICLYIVEGDFPRKSCWPPSAKTNPTQISNIAEGDYVVYATAVFAGGTTASTPKQPLKVIGERGWRIEDGL